MAGYGIQNAVSNTFDNSLKIKKLMDLLPTEQDKALEDANRKAEASSLRADLAEEDAEEAQSNADKAQQFADGVKKRSAARKRAVTRSVNKGETPPEIGDFIKENEERMSGHAELSAKLTARDAKTFAQRARQKADQAQQDRRAAIKTKIDVLESAGQRKKSIFEKLRGGSK